MKIWAFSDLHLPFGELDYELELPDADVCVVAGDVTSPPLASMRWLQHHIGERMPVIFVAGNHEYYGQIYVAALDAAKMNSGAYPGVYFLENSRAVIGGVRFLGATLWTDFDLYWDQHEGMRVARAFMNDYRTIMYGLSPPERLTPRHTLDFHRASRAWIENELAQEFDGKTVVVTHTCPHRMSVDAQYDGDPVTPAFTSDLSELITTYQPAAWFHGHTHTSFDYVAPGTQTRVICNPRGYVRQTNSSYAVENMMFERYKVVEI
ncbi:metallophosphoesterase [Rhizobium leguminosarum]|uniref:metallophosphoesterase n=1 Tax=Rhizobium leguminosarum TaxID=384 RepID=UPI001F1AC5BD|nr:metallophosphoesterase [Rhizobium leguminosarum]UIJ79110.1 metallophosphoesterase [Rhizobium leguminosarum]